MAMRNSFGDEQTDDFVIDVLPELRKRIKIAAGQSGLSVQEYVEQILEQAVPNMPSSIDEAGKLNRAAVDKLLRTREAIRRAHPDVVFEDSAELIREAREERSQQLEKR